MASAVELEPAPATTGTRRRACSVHHSTTRLCSSWDRVGLSPVVPTGTSPLVPSAICQSTRSRKAFSSTDPLLNGVTSAVNEPRNLVLAAMIGSIDWSAGADGRATCPGNKWAERHRYRFTAALESPLCAVAPSGYHVSQGHLTQ